MCLNNPTELAYKFSWRWYIIFDAQCPSSCVWGIGNPIGQWFHKRRSVKGHVLVVSVAGICPHLFPLLGARIIMVKLFVLPHHCVVIGRQTRNQMQRLYQYWYVLIPLSACRKYCTMTKNPHISKVKNSWLSVLLLANIVNSELFEYGLIYRLETAVAAVIHSNVLTESLSLYQVYNMNILIMLDFCYTIIITIRNVRFLFCVRGLFTHYPRLLFSCMRCFWWPPFCQVTNKNDGNI